MPKIESNGRGVGGESAAFDEQPDTLPTRSPQVVPTSHAGLPSSMKWGDLVMFFLSLLSMIAQTSPSPTPLDAFRANYAAIKAEMDFVIVSGKIDSSFLSDGTIWSAKSIPLKEEQSDRLIEGTWACDGAAEYFYCGSPESIIAKNRERFSKLNGSNGEVQLGYMAKLEGLFDGDVMAEHVIDDPYDAYRGALSVWKHGNDILYVRGKGPFSWWECPFPYFLGYRFPKTVPRVVSLTRASIPMDVEVYTQELAKGWLRLEVAYDPAVGYVPRHTRFMSSDTSGKTFVKETYVVAVEHCKAGGFVPTEWYIADYRFDDFASRYPNYDESVNLVPPKSLVYVQHFQSTRFRDRTEPVALTHVGSVDEVAAAGGTVNLPKGVGRLTLANIKTRLGRKLTQTVSAPLPSIDVAELHEFDRTPSRPWPWVMAVMASVLAVLGWIGVRRLRRKTGTVATLLTFTSVLCLQGCGVQSSPAVNLTGRVSPAIFLFGSGPSKADLKLVVKNDGTQRLDLLRVEGDCSCRQVDQSGFPRAIRPGEETDVPFTAQLGPSTHVVSARFTFDTPNGSIPVFVTFHPLASHQLSPESAAHNSIVDDEPWEFELTHRSVFRTNDQPESVSLVVPTEISLEKTSTHSGPVADADGYSFKDETYQVKVTSREKGMHKTEILLNGNDHQRRAACVVVWNRVPFVSSNPERVTLGERPVRVFLRCPDDAVELTQVLSAPSGVKAVVSSTRELTVTPHVDFKGAINGTLEVGTSSKDHPLLSVPIIRYVSQASFK